MGGDQLVDLRHLRGGDDAAAVPQLGVHGVSM
jgi:hypothetical protein